MQRYEKNGGLQKISPVFLLADSYDEVETQFDEQEKSTAAVTCIATQTMPYKAIEEIHGEAGYEEQPLPGELRVENLVLVVEPDIDAQGKQSLQGKKQTGNDTHAAIDGVCLRGVFRSCIWHHLCELSSQQLSEGVGS